MTRPEALVDVFEQPAGARVPGTELGERIPLERRDATGQQEGQPHGRTGDLTGGTQQREDPGPDHRPDPDEGRLSGADVAHAGRHGVTVPPSLRITRPFGPGALDDGARDWFPATPASGDAS